MQHKIAPNGWSCLLTSFAMVLDVEISNIVKVLGHDGSEIFWPDLEEPTCRRGFHIQEMIDYCYINGYMVTPFEAVPCSKSKISVNHRVPETFLTSEQRIFLVMKEKGVIEGITKNNQRHAVAWNGNQIYDPNGQEYGLSEFGIQTFWLIVKSNQVK